MKKIISVILTAVLLMSFLTFGVFAANDGIIKAERITAKAGEEITVPVTYVNNPGIYVIRVTVNYDADVVEYVDINKSAADVFNYTVNPTDGRVIVLMDAQQMANVTEDFELFGIKFKVKDKAKAGRALFPVYCEEGMATALLTENGKLTPVSLAPSTSSGSVTVLCTEHTFDIDASDGTKQCSKCGAVKTADGEVSVDVDAGLPEIDVSSGESLPSQTAPDTESEKSDSEQKGDGEEGGLSFGHFVPIIAAVVIVAVVCTVIIITKGKKNGNKTDGEQEI